MTNYRRFVQTTAAALLFASAAVLPPQSVAQADGAVAAAATLKQNPLQLKARLSVRSVALGDALASLQKQSGASLFYSPSQLPSYKVTCQCFDLTVAEALDRMLEDSRMRYSLLSGHVVIEPQEVQDLRLRDVSSDLAGPGFLLAARGRAPAINPATLAPRAVDRIGTISGRVVDAQTQQPLASAQVFILETSIGALTRADGTYQLVDVPDGTHTVRVQLIGYTSQTQTVTVLPGSNQVLDFEMTGQALALDEIVVTGTAGGTQRRAVGNVVERVNMAERLETGAVTSVEQTLMGGVPGVTMLTGSGMAGGGGQIRLRGSSSAALAGDPIIYVDGVRMNSDRGDVGRYTATSRLDDIDPADIESIEIIKGPAAATLYGTEASNGVIQIITKKGVSGAPQFDASVELGSSWLPRDMIPTSWAPDPARCAIAPCQPGDLVEIDLYQRELDRGNKIFDPGVLQGYNLSVRGGTDLIQYFASVNHNDQDGIVEWNWNKRSSGRLSLSVLPSDAISLSINTSYAQSETALAGSFWGNNFAWGGRPATALIDGHPDRGFSSAPELNTTDVHLDLIETDRTTWSAEIRHQPTEWLSHRLVGGLDLFREKATDIVYRNPLIADRLTAAREGSKSIDAIEAPTVTVDFSGTVSFRPTENLGSATSYGLQYYSKQNYLTTASGTNFATPSLTTVGAAAVTTGGESFVENSTVGVYFQQQFDWDNRIFLTGAIRADDNSAFGSNFDAAIYPKLSATWVVHDESFWNVPVINQLRLRGAWGAAGQQPDAFASTRLYTPITGANGQPGLTPITYGNDDLGPERGEELELGFDASAFDSRVDLTFTAFWRKTKDALVERPLAPSLGYTAHTLGSFQLTNAGLISSWGTETALGVRALTEGPLRWDLDVAFTTLGNRIDDLAGIERIPVQRGRAHEQGYPLASIIEYKVVSADFVEGNAGAVTNVMCDGGTGPDGKQMGGPPVPCDEAPRVFWGQGEPKWLLNFVSSWTLFDNWQVSATIDAKGGHWMSSDYLGARHSSFPSSRLIFLQDDPIAMGYLQVARSGLTFHRADFAKLREVTVGYTVPSSLAQRFGARSASLRFGARNLLTLWRAATHVEREEIIDPEMNRPDENFGGESGGDWPPLSQAVFTIRVGF